jgi:hypothetical protein
VASGAPVAEAVPGAQGAVVAEAVPGAAVPHAQGVEAPERGSAEAALRRRCRRLVRAYPPGVRADEVLATLLDTNEGRRRPRAGDVPDVLWHGLVERLRATTVPSTRYGRWGDVGAVAVVLALVMQAGAGAAVAARWFVPGVRRIVMPGGRVFQWPVEMFGDRREAYLATAAALLAVATAVAACLGRVKVARWLTAGIVSFVFAGAVAARMASPWGTEPFRNPEGRMLAAGGLALVGAVVLTGAVARAAALVPRRWWAAAAVVCGATGWVCTDLTLLPYMWGRSAPVILTFAVQALLLMALALPLVRRRPALLAGTALLALPAVPAATYLLYLDHLWDPWWHDAPSGRLPLTVAAACVAALLVSAVVLRRERAED